LVRMIPIIQTRAPAMRETPEEAGSRSILQLAVETTLHFFAIPRLAVGVGLTTHSQQIRRPGLGRLTCPRDRQQVGDSLCRICGEGEARLGLVNGNYGLATIHPDLKQ
jgi:hypothetical protein